MKPTSQVFLSRRNLLTLLAKLDGVNDGIPSGCTLIKNSNPTSAYRQTMKKVWVTAVEDEPYYAGRDPSKVREDHQGWDKGRRPQKGQDADEELPEMAMLEDLLNAGAAYNAFKRKG